MNKKKWFLYRKVDFYPFDIAIVNEGYTRGKNDAFSWRFKNLFFYFTNGFEYSFRSHKDLAKVTKVLKRRLNKNFVDKVGWEIRQGADDLLKVTKTAFKDKQSLIKNFDKFQATYASLTAIFQTPEIAQHFLPEKPKKLLFRFGLCRDQASRKLAVCEKIYRPALIKILKNRNALFLLPHEVKRYFETRQFPRDLDRRKTEMTITINGKTRIYWNKRADAIFKNEYLRFVGRNWERNSVSGQTAYNGKVAGSAYVAINENEFKKIPKKSILVCSMTRYTMTPYLPRVSAIVTDQGGITCHAAIMARELKVPTIIDTKIATDIFKTGDMVEVDAQKGVVRILPNEE